MRYFESNIGPADTGLRLVVFVSQGQTRHPARVKFGLTARYDPHNTVSIRLHDLKEVGRPKLDSSDYAQVCQWIDLNRNVLLEFWDGDLLTRDMLNRIQSI